MTMATAIELQHRFVPIEAPKEQADTLEFSFSSEEPVKRYFGDEVLDHSEESVDLARLNSGVAPLLFNHDPSLVLGVVQRAWLQDRKGRAQIRWAENPKAQEVRADVENGILKGISVGYTINQAKQEDEKTRAISWTPHELSVVSIPADFKSIGIGRAIQHSQPSTKKQMSDYVHAYSSLEEDTRLPLDPEEQKRYSLINMVKAVVNNDFTNAGFERECSRAIEEQTGTRARGFYIPSNLQVRTPYITTTATAAGNLVGTVLDEGNFIDALRKSLKVFELGATILGGNVGNLDVPRQSGLTSTYWVAEGSNLTESNATFDKISLTPKTVGALSSWTRIQELQATPDLEQLV